MPSPIAVIDFETTGMSPAHGGHQPGGGQDEQEDPPGEPPAAQAVQVGAAADGFLGHRQNHAHHVAGAVLQLGISVGKRHDNGDG